MRNKNNPPLTKQPSEVAEGFNDAWSESPVAGRPLVSVFYRGYVHTPGVGALHLRGRYTLLNKHIVSHVHTHTADGLNRTNWITVYLICGANEHAQQWGGSLDWGKLVSQQQE